MNVINELNQLTRETFGNSTRSSVARCPAFGHDDFCFIFRGEKADTAAGLLAGKFDGKVNRSEVEFLGETLVSYSVTFKLNK
jgi:hypothetical protein